MQLHILLFHSAFWHCAIPVPLNLYYISQLKNQLMRLNPISLFQVTEGPSGKGKLQVGSKCSEGQWHKVHFPAAIHALMDGVRDWGHWSRPLLRCLSFGASWSKLMVGKYCDILNRIGNIEIFDKNSVHQKRQIQPFEVEICPSNNHLQKTIWILEFMHWRSQKYLWEYYKHRWHTFKEETQCKRYKIL